MKSHLLLLRETLTSSLDCFSHALPEEILSVFSQCLSTFNVLEVPFIFIDNVLLKQEYVKNKIQYHILESRDKIEHLAKHQLETVRDIKSLAGGSSGAGGASKNLVRQNLKAKRRITQVCVDLQALHFQYCSLYRTFSNVVDLVCELRKEENVQDLSDYVSDLASRLFQAQMNPDIASLSSHSDKSLPRDLFTLDTLQEQAADNELSPVTPGTSPRSTGSVPEIRHTKLSRSREPSNESCRTRGESSSAPSSVTPVVECGDATPDVPAVLPAESSAPEVVVTAGAANTGAATTTRPSHKDKKRTHRRGYSEANIEMFKSVQLEFSEGINKSSVSQNNLHINAAAVSPTTPPGTELGDSDSVNNIHLSQVDVRVENLAQEGGSEDDSCSVMSEVPPPPTPGTESLEEMDFPLPPPPNEAYYTSPQIARREIERGIQHAPSTESIPEEEPEESLYTEMGELKLLSQLELEEKRSRKGSSNEGSRDHSRTSSNSGGPHSTSLSSEEGSEVKIPIPGHAEQEMTDMTLTGTTLQLSPSNQTLQPSSPTIYTGIMSSLTAPQCIVFINDHINANADTAAIETLHQARARFGGFYFGSTESEDTLTLVGIFCQHGKVPGSSGSGGKVALWGSICEDMVKTTLMTDTLHLENAIKSFT